MAWQTPKTNWTPQDSVTDADMNRIEGNLAVLRNADGILLIDTEGQFVAGDVEGALHELYNNAATGKSAVASAITAMGQAASTSDDFSTLANKIRAISTDADAAVGDVLTGKTFYQGGAKRTGTMPNNGSVIITPGTANQAIAAGYHNGSGYVKGDANLSAGNIKEGISIFGVTGILPYGTLSAGNSPIITAATERTVTSTTTTKIKEIKIKWPGSIYVAFEFYAVTYRGYVEIRKNGSHVGSTSTTVTTYQAFTYPTAINVAAGDLIQLYGYVQSSGGTLYVKNFQINVAPNLALGDVLLD